MNVIFRADASPDIGGGHVTRCLTLADALIGQGWVCTFLSAPGSEDTVPALKQERYNLARSAIMDLSADVLVVDHYGLDAGFESDCRAWAKKIVVIDDLADRPHDCDLLMDQTLGRDPADYKAFVPPRCRILTGPDYALLRPQFAAARPAALARRGRQAGRVGRILVMLSTGDRDNVTGLVLAGLERPKGKFVVDVVMGAGAPHLQAVRQQAGESRHNVIVRAGVGDVAELMADADLCIGAGGTASWERCCMGLPTVVIEIADNQRKIIEGLDKAGAIFKAGWHRDLTAEIIAGHVQVLIDNPARIVAMGVVAATICEGKGAELLAAQIGNLLKNDGLENTAALSSRK